MTRYLISFDDGAMNHIPTEDWDSVGGASHKVMYDAKDAGVWIFGGGLLSQRASIVATDGTITDGPYPETKAVIGGFSIIDVPSRQEALECGQDRRRLPVCPGGTGDHVRPGLLIGGPRGQLMSTGHDHADRMKRWPVTRLTALSANDRMSCPASAQGSESGLASVSSRYGMFL